MSCHEVTRDTEHIASIVTSLDGSEWSVSRPDSWIVLAMGSCKQGNERARVLKYGLYP